MAQFPVGDFLDSLKTALTARPGLDGVDIYTADPGPDVNLSSVIVLGSGPITGTTPWAAIGTVGHRDDQPTITATILAVRAGAGDTVAKTARDRVAALASELIDELKTSPQVGEQTLAVEGFTYTFDQYATDVGGVSHRVAGLDLKFTPVIRVS